MSLPGKLNEHFTGTSTRKRPKKEFNTFSDALEFIEKHGITGKVPYKCSFCGKYHIGS